VTTASEGGAEAAAAGPEPSVVSTSGTTRGPQPRVAFITCAELPELDPDDLLAVTALAERGISAVPAVWDDPAVDWSGYDAAVLRSTWDYPGRRAEFLDWARRVPRLANPATVVEWNTDKRYLAALTAGGVPVVATRWVAPEEAPWRASGHGEYVIKPSVGAGSVDTGRYDLAEPEHRTLAEEHANRLLAEGRTVLVQPYLPAVDRDGETALIFVGGRYSHAIRKGALLDGPYQSVDGLYKVEEISHREATPAQLTVARQALRAIPYADPADLLYARVDLIPGPDGAPLLVELELTEPSLFLGYASGAADRFADAIAARLDRLG
jgi:glutathione synthase/RimK-type ligase-like ATP-grasp enzyme